MEASHPTQLAQASLLVACAAFALQSALHWMRAACAAINARAQQHELLSGAATSACALMYQGMACGISGGAYYLAAGSAELSSAEGGGADGAPDSRQPRIFFAFHYLARSLAGSVVLLNVAALARERRPPAVALAAVWCLQTGALYLGTLVQGAQRTGFLVAACWLVLPFALILLAVMGGRLRFSELQTVYRFLAMWCIVCSAGYSLVFFCSEMFCLFNSETELVAYMLLDYCVVGVSSLVISCAGSELQVGLLPAQEAELSLYPGPHNHGFYPNPDYYDDNL